MNDHHFIFTPGCWLGEGKIRLNLAEEELTFYMRWNIEEAEEFYPIECVQEIQVVGLSEIMHNEFSVLKSGQGSIDIELENQAVGAIYGLGLVDNEKISWEFDNFQLGFAGFELYQKLAHDQYRLHAEYASSDQFRTVIEGRIWKQGENGEEES